MYTVVVNLETVGTYPDFYSGFKAFHDAILAEAENGISLQALETACWIECLGRPLYWNQVCDRAHRLGILKDNGELQKTPPDQQIVDKTL